MKSAQRSVLLAACLAVACNRGATVEQATVTDEQSPPELAALVAEVMPKLERLSGLDQKEPIRVRMQDRAAIRGYVEQRLLQELPADELEGIRATYALIGLIPDTLALRPLLLDLYTEQVVGYYDPRTRTLYALSEADGDALRTVLTHELVHALQDQHTNLDSLISRERGNDRQTAAHAAMEGHAMVVMFAALAEEAARNQVDPAALPNPAEQLRPSLAAQTEQFPVFRRAPGIIRETLLFPYVEGSDFVHTLWRSRRGAQRYPAPIDSLLPQSTQQVMAPLAHFIQQRTAPVELAFENVPAGVRVVYENTFGQLETSILLAHHLGDAARASAAGWRGDRYLVVQDGDGHAMLWLSLWETPAAAQAFAQQLRAAAPRRPARSVVVELTEVGSHAAVRVTDTPRASTVQLGGIRPALSERKP